ncbi:non-homologous end-joining DNA ligase [uncultured Williamsia sp.]|uniref:non-homologous end-joining DNA ligase n=1 Tax=uncultured Williamsia sp. TaxID=259311 RepID=UPI0026279829|nr:non-homologous end-joining DNA ligase [uncultured Williamsia sp.]
MAAVRVAPMLATPGSVLLGDGFAYEMKYDGQRGMATVDGRGVRLSSRNGTTITRTYPDVVAGIRRVLGGREAILDGEVVALDESGRPSFGLLQRRMHTQRAAAALVREVPARFFVFDVLASDGRDVTGLPYTGRRALLEDLVSPGDPVVQVPPSWTAADGVDGQVMLELAAEHGLEGVVAKRLSSRYRPGQRSPDWIKQPLRVSATVVVAGWIGTPEKMESLLLAAVHPTGGLRYIGHVGTGFTRVDREDLLDQLGAIERPTHPFASPPPRWASGDHVRWVHPVLLGEVHFREFTTRLRHASWRGLRPDAALADARWPG